MQAFEFFERPERLAKRAVHELLAQDLNPVEEEIARTVDPDQRIIEGLTTVIELGYDPEATVEFDIITDDSFMDDSSMDFPPDMPTVCIECNDINCKC